MKSIPAIAVAAIIIAAIFKNNDGVAFMALIIGMPLACFAVMDDDKDCDCKALERERNIKGEI